MCYPFLEESLLSYRSYFVSSLKSLGGCHFIELSWGTFEVIKQIKYLESESVHWHSYEMIITSIHNVHKIMGMWNRCNDLQRTHALIHKRCGDEPGCLNDEFKTLWITKPRKLDIFLSSSHSNHQDIDDEANKDVRSSLFSGLDDFIWTRG